MALTKHIEELCHAVSREHNPKKMLSLIDELNKELDRTAETPTKDALLNKSSTSPQKDASDGL